MGDWWILIGPLIAVVLSLGLKPTHLVVLGVAAGVGFYVSFTTSSMLYGECDPCSSTAETLFWLNGILFTLAPALLVVGVAKAVVMSWPRRRSNTPTSSGQLP